MNWCIIKNLGLLLGINLLILGFLAGMLLLMATYPFIGWPVFFILVGVGMFYMLYMSARTLCGK